MIRWLAIIALMGCTPVDHQIANTDGHPIEYAYVFMQPLCLIFCSTNLATSGMDNDTIGDNASGGATTSTQSQTGNLTGGN